MTPYQDAADRFQAASADFANALRDLGGEDLAAIKTDVAQLKERTDPTKWLALAVSILSLGLAGWGAHRAYEASKTTGQVEVLKRIRELADIPRVSTPAGTPAASAAPAVQHYHSVANQIAVIIGKEGFHEVDVHNFVSLMQATLAFRDVKRARQWWTQEPTVKGLTEVEPQYRVQLALLYGDYARLAGDTDNMRAAAFRLAPLSASASKTDRVFIHISLTDLYAHMLPRSLEDLKVARRNLESARKNLEALKESDPAAGTDYETQHGPQITALETQLNGIERELQRPSSRPRPLEKAGRRRAAGE